MYPLNVLIISCFEKLHNEINHILTLDSQFESIVSSSTFDDSIRELENKRPDIILLDIDTPYEEIDKFSIKASQANIPIIILSVEIEDNEFIANEAMKYNAVELIDKNFLGKNEFASILVNTCLSIADQYQNYSAKEDKSSKNSVDVILPFKYFETPINDEQLILIGISTGGAPALRKILPLFPKDSPCILIVQHMPMEFTEAFSKQLDKLSQMNVSEARAGDPIMQGHVLIAPGSRHMLLKKNHNQYYLDLLDGPLINWHKPSIDVLFRSAAQCAGANISACVMTGMGDDGAQGLLELKRAGARTFAQDEASCAVFGMPKAAIQIGATKQLVTLEDIPDVLLDFTKSDSEGDS